MRRGGKSVLAALMSGVLAVGALAGCGAESGTAAEVNPEILVVSFGTSYNVSRNITIGGIESAIRENFPDYDVERAFTAQTIIDKLKSRDGVTIFNVTEALDDAAARGVKRLVVQPTHLMNGYEYTDLKNELEKYSGKFESISLGEPLLTSEEDYVKVAEAIVARTKEYDDGKTAICFMGHGTEADSNSDYAKMQEVLTTEGYENYYVGTVEAEPTVDDLVAAIDAKGNYTRVVLEPLMVVSGDHANNDMAGDEEDSWKSIFEAAGYEVECILEGLGQNNAVQDIYVEHVRAAIGAADAQ